MDEQGDVSGKDLACTDEPAVNCDGTLLSDKEELEIKVHSLEEQVKALQEMLNDRDDNLVKLTNKVYELEKGKRDKSPCREEPANRPDAGGRYRRIASRFYSRDKENKVSQNSERPATEKKCKDVKLTSDQRIAELEQCCQEWEAKCCQIQSKFLFLLNEINQSITSHTVLKESDSNQGDVENGTATPQKQPIIGDALQDLVHRLLKEDSLSSPLIIRDEPEDKPKKSSHPLSRSVSIHDELGFYFNDNDDSSSIRSLPMEDDTIAIMKARDNRKLLNLRAQNEAKCLQLHSQWWKKWEDYLANLTSSQLERTMQLMHLIRSGVPQEYRYKIWMGVIQTRIKLLREHFNLDDTYYDKLLNQKHGSTAESASKGCDLSAKQIELDLLRTLPSNKNFESLDSAGTLRLRRVLIAYSRHNPAVGYCQGLNRLAAVALLFMPEEDAFWCLVAIIETIMPRDYYSHNLMGAHVDQYVLKDLLAEKMPRLHAHFDQLNVELNLFSWFLTCFVDNIPVRIYLRIWDVFLYEGSKVLFRFALAILKMYEEEILKLSEETTVNAFLRMLGERLGEDDVATSIKPKSMDHPSETMNELIKIAFDQLNPLPIRVIRDKRQYYTDIVKAELDRLDEIRSTLPSHQSTAEEEEIEEDTK